MKNPKQKIELEKLDYFIELVGLIGLIALVVLPIFYYSDLPNEIPNHYNNLGQPDSFSYKNTIWLIPFIGVILYIGMGLLSRFPNIYTYPVKVTQENAKRLYRIGVRSIRILKVCIIILFSYLNYATIRIGLNEVVGLGSAFLPVFLIVTFAIIGVTIFKLINN